MSLEPRGDVSTSSKAPSGNITNNKDWSWVMHSLGAVVDETDLILNIQVVSPVRHLGTSLQLAVAHDWCGRLVVNVERSLLGLFAGTAERGG